MPQKAKPSQPLVLRVEISADQAQALGPLLAPEATPAEPAAAPAPTGPPPDMIAERARLAEREAELQARAKELEERERELEQVEATASEKIRLAHRAKRVADAEGRTDDRAEQAAHGVQAAATAATTPMERRAAQPAALRLVRLKEQGGLVHGGSVVGGGAMVT